MGPLKMGQRTLMTAAALALVGASAACAPVRDIHGFTAATPEQLKIEPGVDTKETVLRRLGTPSTESLVDQTTWYYVTSTQERFAFYEPRVVDREVLVVRFREDGVVDSTDTFGEEKGKPVRYSADRTPTRGRELGIIEQIFGNVGRASPIAREEDRSTTRDRRR
jgi:outer membrane protein assembly factor BamE (lipoprotein component of BamABCDE complex)